MDTGEQTSGVIMCNMLTFIPILPLSFVYLFMFTIFSLSSLKVDVCAAVSGVGIPRSVGKQLCTMRWNDRGRQQGKAQRVGQ